jgi:rare lipoprotein A
VSVNEFTSRVISQDMDAVNDVQNAESDLSARKEDLATRRAHLLQEQARVHSILTRMQAKLAQAREVARRADLTVSFLEQQQAAIEAAKRREADRQHALADQSNSDSQLVTGGSGTVPDPPGFDQAHLLSLLGPTGGQTCTIPPGLRDTGQRISGKATWYGPGFVGKHTASGAIFDPRLFTAAHRTLPFGTFLRVHHGGRCAIVLVNDRGPWIYDRIIDLSEAAGHYLGVSLTYVDADILVPA